MTTTEEKEAWTRIGNSMYAEDFEASDQNYTVHAEFYDQDLFTLRSCSFTNMAKRCMEYFPNNESALVLDAASGTGLCGEALKRHGFKGIMDALEANAAMLKKAERKSVYRNHIQFKLSPGVALPIEAGTYDAVICSGAFTFNQVQAASFADMMGVLKPGGIIAVNTRFTPGNAAFRLELENVIENLVLSGKAEKVAVEEILACESVLEESGEALKMKLYIYRRPL